MHRQIDEDERDAVPESAVSSAVRVLTGTITFIGSGARPASIASRAARLRRP